MLKKKKKKKKRKKHTSLHVLVITLTLLSEMYKLNLFEFFSEINYYINITVRNVQIKFV